MKKSNLLLTLTALLAIAFMPFKSANAQNYQVTTVGFYNFENLFDTLASVDILDTEKFLNQQYPYIETFSHDEINEEDYVEWKAADLSAWLQSPTKEPMGKVLLEKRDDDFTASGSLGNNTKVYEGKLKNLAKVVSEMGTNVTPDGLAILGIAEIEQRSVLEDFVKQEAIKDRNYQVIHHNSMDFRGIDVGLIYQPKYFTPEQHTVLPVDYYDNDKRLFTRDVLWVEGLLNGEKVHIFVNHWPSRRGGEQLTVDKRKAAAQVCRNVIDSLRNIDENVKTIVLGDLNDHPVSPSVKDILRAVNKPEKVTKNLMYNPFIDKYKKGNGSNAWRDSWGLFDQIILSKGWLDKTQDGLFFYKAEIFNKPYLIQKTGQYRGYPFRSFIAGRYAGGYSDHLPVLVYLVKEVK